MIPAHGTVEIPFMGNADTSGVIPELSVAEDNRQQSTRHCHTDIGESPPIENGSKAILNNGRSSLVCDGGTGPQINGTAEFVHQFSWSCRRCQCRYRACPTVGIFSAVIVLNDDAFGARVVSKIGCVGWSNHWIYLPAIVESGQVIWGFTWFICGSLSASQISLFG